MTAKERIENIRLLELIHSQEEFCREAGIYDASVFDGKRIFDENVPEEAGFLDFTILPEEKEGAETC